MKERPPHVRWLNTIEQIQRDGDWLEPRHTETVVPGWIDVRVYPELAECTTALPPGFTEET